MRLIHSKIKGISKFQENITDLKEGVDLNVVKEPNNQFDRFAIALYHNGKQLGYISKELAKEYYYKIKMVNVNNLNKGEITGANINIYVEGG